MKPTGGRICSFSPCIEQTQKVCAAFSDLGFQEIQTIELLQTQYTVQHRPLGIMHLDFLESKKGTESTDEKIGKKDIDKIVTSVPRNPQPGHTGYLTFATLLPEWTRMKSLDCDN